MKPTLYIPARSAVGAEEVARAIDAGTVPALYLTPQAAMDRAAVLRRTDAGQRAYEVPLIATDDGWIRVARLIDTAGQVAAAAAIVIGGPFLVGFASLFGG